MPEDLLVNDPGGVRPTVDGWIERVGSPARSVDTGGLFGTIESRLDTVGAEVECRAPVHLDRVPFVMGDDEYGTVEGRVIPQWSSKGSSPHGHSPLATDILVDADRRTYSSRSQCGG